MKLNIAAELKIPGKEGYVKRSEPMADMEYLARWIRFAEPVEVEARYVFDGTGFTVKGTVQTAFSAECARCMKEFNEPFVQEFEERFEKNAPEDGEVYGYRGEELDLSDLVRDTILLHMPTVSLCKEDCCGLCPVCGCDLNTVRCSCQREPEEEPTNPFSGLKALLNDDKEV